MSATLFWIHCNFLRSDFKTILKSEFNLQLEIGGAVKRVAGRISKWIAYRKNTLSFIMSRHNTEKFKMAAIF